MKRVLMLKRLCLHKNLIFLNHLSSQYLLVMFVYARDLDFVSPEVGTCLSLAAVQKWKKRLNAIEAVSFNLVPIASLTSVE